MAPSFSPLSDPGNAGRPAPTPEQQQEERPLGYQARPGSTPPPLTMPPLSLNVNVHRRGLDPFILGVLIGAIAAIIGMLAGLSVLLMK